jgi:transposase InsO family protein
MKLHGNAALSLNQRRRLARRVLEERCSLTSAAAAAEVSEPTARKWANRFREEGETGLLDRPSAAHRVHNPHRRGADRGDLRPAATAPHRRRDSRGARDARDRRLGHPHPSGLGRLGRLGLEPACRYERSRPGELIHIDVKKLGRIGPNGAGHRMTGRRLSNRGRTDAAGRIRRHVGWEFVHVCDDATRLAYVEVLADEKGRTAVGFLRRAIDFFGRHGVTVERVLTDNGSAYRSAVHALACRALGIRHLRTRPYRPHTNGKAERFIRTMLGGWAYGAIYRSSAERTAALDGWLWRYNFRRPHGALGRKTPAARLAELINPLGSYI